MIVQLTRLLDPRPGIEPDFETLVDEFTEAGFDSDSIPHFRLEEFLRTFASDFYAAAAAQDALRGLLEMKLQGEMVNRLGSVARDSQRSAEATERMAEQMHQFLGNRPSVSALPSRPSSTLSKSATASTSSAGSRTSSSRA